MALTGITKLTTLSELEAWGKITDFGGELLHGTTSVDVYGKMTLGNPTDAISAGYFGTTRGIYRLVYPFSEQAIILEGEVDIIDESTGIKKTFKKGDLWIVEKGISTIWDVKSDFFVKHFFAAV